MKKEREGVSAGELLGKGRCVGSLLGLRTQEPGIRDNEFETNLSHIVRFADYHQILRVMSHGDSSGTGVFPEGILVFFCPADIGGRHGCLKENGLQREKHY